MKVLVGFLMEILLLPMYFLAGVVGYVFPLQRVKRENSNKSPIVFVHGWLTQNPLYCFLKRSLENKGFIVYMTNFGLLSSDFNQDAQRLKDFIESKNLKDVVLVGVSGGGIVSYLYLQHFEGWKRVKKFVSIATPFGGASLAILATLFSGSARQMMPDSFFVSKIKSERVKNPEKIVSISAKYDEAIPQENMKLADVEHRVVDCFGHVFLQTISSNTFSLIENYAEE